MQLSDRELQAAADSGIAVFADRLVLDAQPPIDDATLAKVAGRCVGPLPVPLVELWRTSFGGSLDYDLAAELDGQDAALSFTELFHPGSDGYHDLWGWIEHERELAAEHQPGWCGRLTHLPIGGFEYLDRVYVDTTPGPEHGAVVCWRQGLPPGWELTAGDRAGRIAGDVRDLFGQLVLERDPWRDDPDAGADMRSAVDELAGSGDRDARAAAGKLRDLVRAAVLDWRGALERGTIRGDRRLRRLALDRAAGGGDVALLDRLVELGCDPAEVVRGGLTPIDVALLNDAPEVVRRLLDRRVPVTGCLRVGAHAVDLGLARELLDRGAAVDAMAVGRAVDNPDTAVLDLLAGRLPAGEDLHDQAPRLRMLAAQAGIAADPERAALLRDLADRFDRR